MGLDRIEWGISVFASAIALLSTLFFIPRLLKNSTITVTAKPSATKTCATGYHLVASLCEKSTLVHPSYWWPQFLEILIVGVGLLVFTLWRKRAGVIVTSLLLGLASGTAGLLFLALGGWLSLRAFRLQRYGDATFAGSNRMAREQAKARNAERKAAPRSRGRKAEPSSAGPKTPAPSKRYTPKQQRRTR